MKWSYASASPYIIARGIAEDLPKPVDPDLIEARKLAWDRSDARRSKSERQVLSGECDDGTAVSAMLVAIKRGRELERAA